MNNIKDDKYFASKALEDINTIIAHTQNMSYEEFMSDNWNIDATMFHLIQIGESINHLTREFKENNNSIKWGQIIGFRNGIVHDYGETDYSIVYEIVSKDIYKLKLFFETIF